MAACVSWRDCLQSIFKAVADVLHFSHDARTEVETDIFVLSCEWLSTFLQSGNVQLRIHILAKLHLDEIARVRMWA